jgi:hypothetical protein
MSRIFVKSLRETGYDGDIVFISGTNDPNTLSKYNEYKVKILECESVNKFITEKYLSFLVDNKEVYDRVLLSDTRDVVFQHNPFEHMDTKLHLVTEDLKINDQYLNKFWVEQDYGVDILSQIGDNTIICAGTTYGGIIPVIDMVSKILVHIQKNYQATLNYLYRTDQLDAVVESNDGHSLVWTIGTKIDTEHDDFYGIIGHHIVTLGNHVAPPIIHQYDRHPRIKKALEDYYADN